MTAGGSCPLSPTNPNNAPSFYARILLLGASIVTGWGSSSNNGFCKPLRDAMRQDGWKVNMVGAHNIGSMVDNDYEGHPGYRVAQVDIEADKSIKYQPNIVVINAGTNDANQNFDVGNFGARHSAMLDKLQRQIPGVTLTVSTLIQGTLPGIMANRDNMNNQLWQLVSSRRSNRQKIMLADVDNPSNFIPTSLIPDGTHPNDEGHRRLAAVFHRAIKEAHRAGFITRPRDTGFSDESSSGTGSGTCDKTFGSGNSQGAVVTQGGSGLDDGVWTQNTGNAGIRWAYSGYIAGTNFTFARLSELFGRHEIVICIFRGIRFADVNGDGLDDMLCVWPDGDTHVSINKGNYTFAGPRLWKKNVGVLQDRVRLADINGDGRKDYCAVADIGDIRCWRNGGQGDYAEYWQDLGVIFTGKGMGDPQGVRFADINGDGRDDWLWVNHDGQVWTYINNRGCTKNSLKPLWREASTSPSHNGPPNRENISTGGAKLKADGGRYCKMIDRGNSAMDYVWVHSTGYLHMYESLGGSFPSQAPYWGVNYIFWRATNFLGREVDRRDLHLADWDGDGLCDIIYVNPDTGSMDGLWLNKYKTVRDLRQAENWQRVNSAGPRGSNQPWPECRGTHIYDLAVRFADVDGNGRSDYLCIEKNGRTWGYLNNGDGGLTYISQFKKTEGKDRANLRFVDINGDGKADMLWLDKFSGDASVWYNRGPIPASGSAFTWEAKGAVYQGAAQGHLTWFNKCPGEGSSTNGDDPDTLTSPKVSIP
ncbi:killer toxin subunits alpha beta [Cladorrhinum sp. PSN332]|nr:killer toxin subunits alpha beta [Cladorrhinum sp. PSN332]